LFETFNELVQQSWSGETKPYHEEMVSVTRQHTDNLIICGTLKWSQDVDVASSDPVERKNIAYTINFYASSHGEELRSKCRTALNSGAALFATEWGTCEASGDGRLHLAEGWLSSRFITFQMRTGRLAIRTSHVQPCSLMRPLKESGSRINSPSLGALCGTRFILTTVVSKPVLVQHPTRTAA